MEVDLVLRSGVFEKAPRLEKFFLYICRLHFEGRADEIKEYSIALEALGRSSDFDPKKDSIVRVEAHRLRKRLEEYYRGAGSDDARSYHHSEWPIPSSVCAAEPCCAH